MRFLSMANGDGAATWSQVSAVASSAIALLALFVGLANRRTAQKALRLSEAQEARRLAKLDLHLNTATSRRSGGDRQVDVTITAVNPTDRDTTLISADLRIKYETGTSAATLVVGHEPIDGTTAKVEPLVLPARLAANDAIVGGLRFVVPAGAVPAGSVRGFQIGVTDARGIDERLDIWSLPEIAE